jgi:hypothetical protein
VKIAAVGVALAAVLCLSACGGGTDTDDSTLALTTCEADYVSHHTNAGDPDPVADNAAAQKECEAAYQADPSSFITKWTD